MEEMEQKTKKKKLGERADRRPFLHNGGPFSSARADISAIWGREGGGARRPLFQYGGAMKADEEGPPFLML